MRGVNVEPVQVDRLEQRCGRSVEDYVNKELRSSRSEQEKND